MGKMVVSEEPQGLGAVLLVEDDPIVALVARQILEEYGFSVTVAPNGETALGHVRAPLASKITGFALAMVDVGLPDISGVTVARTLRDLLPALPIIIASGHALDELEQELEGIDTLTLLGKPYDGASLLGALSSMGFAVQDLES